MGELEDLCSVLAAGVEDYLPVVETCSRRARAAAQRVEVAERRLAAATVDAAGGGSGLAASQEVTAWRWELEDARGELDRVVAEYRGAVDRLSAVARSVSDSVRRVPETAADHAGVAGETLLRLAVVEPAQAGWELTAGLFQDPARWWGTVSSIPGSVWEQVSDPVGTADEMVGGPQYRAGEIGAGVGTTLSMVAGTKYVKQALDDVPSRAGDGDGGGSPGSGGRRPQSVDELLAGVDLLRHEGEGLGHTIERHVDVDDDYLNDRLDNGTALPNGERRDPPEWASAWTDRQTAERVITDVLRDNEERLREFAANDKKVLPLTVPYEGAGIGRCFARDDDSPRPSWEPNAVTIIIRRTPDGDPFVLTAFPTRK
ncbi:RNase A-like domain-containing protein [Thalassiella azotivora]